MQLIQKFKAAVFVYIVRPFLSETDSGIRDCPLCGMLLQHYTDAGWLHMADGDADCYGALGVGKRP